MNKDDFYIGWREEIPDKARAGRNRFFWISMIVICAVAVVFTFAERGFIASYFEYGSPTEVTGQLVNKPVWGLRTMEDGKVKTIPLVGFGKFGAENAMREILAANPEVGEGSTLTLRGTLFYYRDRTWMELTDGAGSLVAKHDPEPFDVEISFEGTQTLAGEIVDPKCFFGVMNPAEKAVHRSCAIRCISGGIPPVLAIRENGEFTRYYFLLDEYGLPALEASLPYVGLPVTITGEVTNFDDWQTLEPSGISLTALDQLPENTITVCDD